MARMNATVSTCGSYRILLVQSGPCGEDVAENLERTLGFAAAALDENPADLVVFPEFGTLPYFCVVEDPDLFGWAEPLDGPTVRAFSKFAREHRTQVVAPLFERAGVRGVFYDSAVVLDREGNIVPGRIPGSGRSVRAYRKVHISSHFDYYPTINEKYYLRSGSGFPIFTLDRMRCGCLICYDRSFPEAWRILALGGAEVVVVISAPYVQRRAESFVYELQTASIQNGLFCVASNKGGVENFRGRRMPFIGSSCVVDPFGKVVAQGPPGEGPCVVRAEIDLSLLEASARRYHYMRDRRPDLYTYLLSEGATDEIEGEPGTSKRQDDHPNECAI